MQGEAATNGLGWSVSGIGDFNHDGWLDIAVGAPGASVNGAAAGAVYIMYGGANGFVQPSQLDGSYGVQLNGGFSTVGEWAGADISAVGDFNGDGFSDLIIGAPYSRPAGASSGAAYIVYGGTLPAASDVNLSAVSNGTYGFRLTGSSASFSGWSVSAGDLNGDGRDDVIVAAPGANGGYAYVVFGHTGASLNMALSGVNGTNGFRVSGGGSGSNFGNSVAGLGDINGDGYGDLIIGAQTVTTGAGTNAGRSYVVFGHAGVFAGNVNALTLNGTDGFSISGGVAGEQSGYSVGAAGDINGDGFADMVIGSNSSTAGAAYVVFGHSGAFAADLSLSGLNGANGFRLSASGSGLFGYVVKTAGDINGDGYDDLIVGAPFNDGAQTHTGSAYVLFGKSGGFSASLDLSTLSGKDGFRIDGDYVNGYAGVSVSAAGDLNDDGYDDLLVGASGWGGAGGGQGWGRTYIVYGHATSAVPVTGGAGDETLNGGAGKDGISGGGGKDVIYGFAGTDTLNGEAGNDTLSGGADADTLHGGADNDIVSGDDGDDYVYGDIGNDKVNGGAGNDHLFGGDGADQMDGGIGTDVLDGGLGNDNLDGGAGADAMTGGAGNDVYYVDDAHDTTVELANEGIDIVRASIQWELGANIEQLELQGSDGITGGGNELNNRLVGNSGGNMLYGYAGADTILGGGGDDWLIGGKGNDLLTGGAGADAFVVLPESVYSSKAPAGKAMEIDFVYDLNKAEGDIIVLSSIDADINTDGDQAFHLATGGFTKHAAEMTLVYTGGTVNQTVLSLDVDGDGKADYQMKITGDVHLDSGGWIL